MRKSWCGLTLLLVVASVPVIGCDLGDPAPSAFEEVEPNDTAAQATVMVDYSDGEFFGVCDAEEDADYFSISRLPSPNSAFGVLLQSLVPDIGLHIYAEDTSFDLTDTTAEFGGGEFALSLQAPTIDIETNVFIHVMCVSTSHAVEYRGFFQNLG